MSDYLRCPACRGKLRDEGLGLRCERCTRWFPVDDGIPALLGEPSESLTQSARIRRLDAEAARYAFVMAGLAVLARAWPPAERRNFVRALGLQRGDRVLDHCCGVGGNLRALEEEVGPSGTIAAMDLSRAMLRRGQRRAKRRRARVEFHQADAMALPYEDGAFAAVIHVGAINQFGAATPQAVTEMVRVTRPGGTVTIVDEGLAPARAHTVLGRLLVRRNALFASRPPLEALPPEVHPELRWVVRGIFYQISFRTPGPQPQPGAA